MLIGAASAKQVEYSISDNEVIATDVATGNIIANIDLGTYQPYGIVANQEGTRVYAVDSVSESVLVIDTLTNELITSIDPPFMSLGNAWGIEISPDGETLYVSTEYGVGLINTETNMFTGKINVEMYADEQGYTVTDFTDVVISQDGNTLYTINFAGYVFAIDTKTNAVTDMLDSSPVQFGLKFHKVIVDVPSQDVSVTWSNPTDILYGTALSDTQLNAFVSVPGTFVYTPPAGTVLSEGIHILHVDFTPTDAFNYKKASKDVTINVLNSTSVPEFPSVTLPVATILGIIVIFGRKKE